MSYCSTVQNTALPVFRKTKNSLITSIRAESKLNQPCFANTVGTLRTCTVAAN